MNQFVPGIEVADILPSAIELSEFLDYPEVYLRGFCPGLNY
jgi:hypothetical protein